MMDVILMQAHHLWRRRIAPYDHTTYDHSTTLNVAPATHATLHCL
jgi:hypothetical protein